MRQSKDNNPGLTPFSTSQVQTAALVKAAVALLLLTLPWLSPFASGPSPAVQPMLVSAACLGMVLLVCKPAQSAWPIAAFFVAWFLYLVRISGLFSLEIAATAQAFALMAGAAALGAQARAQPRQIDALACAWLAAALISAVIGLVQYLGWSAYGYPWISAAAEGVAFGNLRQRNQLATLLGIGMCTCLWLQARAAPKSSDKTAVLGSGGFAKVALWAMPLLAIVDALTSSRTGLVQIIFLAALAWLWRAHIAIKVRRMLWLNIPIYVGASWLIPLLHGRGAPAGGAIERIAVDDYGCGSRKVLWSNVWNLITQKPWTGWGWRELAWAQYHGQFQPRFCEILDNAHNLPLHLAVELGLPFALLVCGVLLYAVWRGKPWSETSAMRQMAWAVLALIAIHSMVEYPLWYGPFQVAAGLAAGLLLRDAPTSFAGWWPRLVPEIWSTVGAVLIVSAGLAGWEYHRISQIYLPPPQRDAAYRENPLSQIQRSWLFEEQLQFARLSVTPVSAANAQELNDLAQRLLHYSPEPRVIETLIETDTMLGDEAAAVAELQRYRAAFPQDYQRWREQRLLSVSTTSVASAPSASGAASAASATH